MIGAKAPAFPGTTSVVLVKMWAFWLLLGDRVIFKPSGPAQHLQAFSSAPISFSRVEGMYIASAAAE